MNARTFVVTLTLVASAAPAFADSRLAMEALTRWIVANKQEALTKTDCGKGSSADGFDFKISCEDKQGRVEDGRRYVGETAIFAAKELGADFATLGLRGERAYETYLVWLPGLGDARLAEQVKTMDGVVIVGEPGARLREELQKRGALLSGQDAMQAAIAAQAKLAASQKQTGVMDNLKAMWPLTLK